jgi:hypothetical protein
VIERSTNGGVTWQDAGALINAGKKYDESLDSSFGNPLGDRQVFTGTSFGYTSTRLKLSNLAGRNVRFRFRIGTDDGLSSLGWVIDDIRIYQCR